LCSASQQLHKANALPTLCIDAGVPALANLRAIRRVFSVHKVNSNAFF